MASYIFIEFSGVHNVELKNENWQKGPFNVGIAIYKTVRKIYIYVRMNTMQITYIVFQSSINLLFCEFASG